MKAFRVIRLFKLARFWKNFKLLLETLWMTMTTTTSFTSLMLVVIFCYTLLGQVLFANKAKFNPSTGLVDSTASGQSPMFNFDTFMNSFQSVFLILINDSQSSIYYNYYRAVSPLASTLFWVTFVIFATKILLNIFIAIILQKFQELTIRNEIF